MFHRVIYIGKKGPATFLEKEWGSIDSRKYNEVILSQVQAWFEIERVQGICNDYAIVTTSYKWCGLSIYLSR